MWVRASEAGEAKLQQMNISNRNSAWLVFEYGHHLQILELGSYLPKGALGCLEWLHSKATWLALYGAAIHGLAMASSQAYDLL